MEIIIQILILFIIINSILKLSFWKWWQAAIFGVIAASFVIWMQRYAVVQSKAQLQDYLSNPKALQDMAVLITVEAGICFAFSFSAMKNLFGRKKKRIMLQLLYWYPSLLIFPVLFYLLTQGIFSFSGVSFNLITYSIAASVAIVLPLAAFGTRYLFPERELRLEVHFLASLFVVILGLLTTVNGNVTYAAAEQALNIQAIILSILLFALTFVIGITVSKLRWQISNKKRMKK